MSASLFKLIGFPQFPEKGENKFYHDNTTFNQNVTVTGELIGESNALILGETTICNDTHLRLNPFEKKPKKPNLFVTGNIFGYTNLTISKISTFNNTLIANRNIIANKKIVLANCGDVAKRIDRADSLPTSDINLKENITPLRNALDKVKQLNGVEFDYKNSENYGYLQKHQIGLIAQEVEKVIPEVVSTNYNGSMGVSYQHLTAVLIEAIKEQQSQIDALKKEIEILKTGENK